MAPETVEDALGVLGPSEHTEPSRKSLPEWLPPLIAHGYTEGKYPGRSAVALAIASGLRRARYGYADFRSAMTNPDNGGGAKYRALLDGDGSEDPEAFLVRMWEKSAEQLAPEKIVADISRVRAGVLAASWPGRRGSTDRAVMLALCDPGTTSATTALAFGSRRIAEVARVQERTVRKALGRLVDSGWLIRAKASRQGDADTYQFAPNLDRMIALCSSPHISKGTMCGSNDHFEDDRVLMHPAFRNGSGLGKNRGQTWLHLLKAGRPVTAQELAEVSGGQRRTVDRHLNDLAGHGLAVKTGTRWEVSGDFPRLDELAVGLGSLDRAEQQAEQHERSRAGFRTALGSKGGQQTATEPASENSETDDAQRWRSEEEQELFRQVGLPYHG